MAQLSSGRPGGCDTVPGLWAHGPMFPRCGKAPQACDSNFSLPGTPSSLHSEVLPAGSLFPEAETISK